MTPAEFIAIRKAAKLTQVQLAALLDLSRVQVSKYENGHSPIPLLVQRYMCGLEQNGEKNGQTSR